MRIHYIYSRIYAHRCYICAYIRAYITYNRVCTRIDARIFAYIYYICAYLDKNKSDEYYEDTRENPDTTHYHQGLHDDSITKLYDDHPDDQKCTINTPGVSGSTTTILQNIAASMAMHRRTSFEIHARTCYSANDTVVYRRASCETCDKIKSYKVLIDPPAVDIRAYIISMRVYTRIYVIYACIYAHI